MGNERLIIEIGGRNAIPVRAIPYITGWRLSPDKVARQLSGDAETAINVLGGMTAYRLVANVPMQVLSKEWDAILASLYMLQHQLKMQYPEDENDHVSPDFGYAAWREQSPFKLPANVFVWKDEFESAFYDAYSPKNLIILDERPGDRELTYAPLLPEGVTIGALLEAFNATGGQIETRRVDVVAPSSVVGVDKKQENPADWKEQARAIADELDTRDAKGGTYSSLTDMADRVAAEMRKRGVNGQRGPVSGATVKREALQGGLWTRPRDKKEAGEKGESGGTTSTE
ncbi:hypothetical protein [Alcaligenes faecalis]|uniref:hypothetical protein n=1 Tax=Alcaligenes faecalis TaxID=511 RepID=UPI002933FEA8|nr:hypothetical protein [Alcaligenes faecalis]MDV2116474.1 hypothetical protein [Alcaligenes faecalis]